jgi:hypothetical protein
LPVVTLLLVAVGVSLVLAVAVCVIVVVKLIANLLCGGSRDAEHE